MHKKLESELMSIAHSILKMQDKDDVKALQEKAKQLYEKLSVLVFVDDYLMTTPNATETKESIISKIESVQENEQVLEKPDIVEGVVVNENRFEQELIKESVEEVFVGKDEKDSSELKEDKSIQPQLTLEDEFRDAISVDITADLFQKVPEIKKVSADVEELVEEKNVIHASENKNETYQEVNKTEGKTSLNDRLQNNLQIGLNDRIAFVKHLFNGDQGDFNRVVSQINTMKSFDDAKSFVLKMVKLDYNWEGKEEYEERFLSLVERKFL